EVLTDSLPSAALPAPATFTLLPLTSTGRCTGSCTPLPEATPGESCAVLTAEAPPEAPPPDLPSPSSLTQALPAAGLRSPTTFTVLPHTLTGTCTGSCTVFPESTPGEPAAAPSAPASAYAGTARPIAPDAAATAILPLRVTRLIGVLPSRLGREHSPAPGATRAHHPSYGLSVSLSPFTPTGVPGVETPAKPSNSRRPPTRPNGGVPVGRPAGRRGRRRPLTVGQVDCT